MIQNKFFYETLYESRPDLQLLLLSVWMNIDVIDRYDNRMTLIKVTII